MDLRSPTRDLFLDAAERATRYAESVKRRSVVPPADALEALTRLSGTLPEEPQAPAEILALLDEVGSPATVATTGGRYFGFVIGGALPISIAAHWLADTWDQNATLRVMSPVAAYVEDVVLDWIIDLLRLPKACGGALVTGAQMANFTCLAAARHAVLERAGWDVEEKGLFGAPEIDVVVGAEAHATLYKALAMLGLGRERVITVPADEQGRIQAHLIPKLDRPAILCTQAGNVNSGAFDPIAEICAVAKGHNAWVHVDGAFGVWARVAPEFAHLAAGLEEADSWAADAHKWLNIPQDCGVALIREPAHLTGAMSISAAYLSTSSAREPMHHGPESSRRARGIEVWAAVRALGRDGLAELITRHCRQARKFAAGLADAGFEVLNEVVLNQVLVSFGSDKVTQRVIAGVQADGTCWCGGTEWHGKRAMRISVSSWATTDEDVETSLGAMIRIARQA